MHWEEDGAPRRLPTAEAAGSCPPAAAFGLNIRFRKRPISKILNDTEEIEEVTLPDVISKFGLVRLEIPQPAPSRISRRRARDAAARQRRSSPSTMVYFTNAFGGAADVRRRLIGSLSYLGKVNQEADAKRRKQNKKMSKKERRELKRSMSQEEHAKHLAKVALDQDREAAEVTCGVAKRHLKNIPIVEWIKSQRARLDGGWTSSRRYKTEGGLEFDEVRITGNPYIRREI